MADRTMTVYRVLGWDAERQIWTERGRYEDVGEAQQRAEALQHKHPRLRVRVRPAVRRLLTVKPPVDNSTRAWRLDRAAAISDLADASKRYKSPG